MDRVIYLTFDMDWASDEVLVWFYGFMRDLAVPYEINVTHDTKVLQKFREDDLVELGIHPNFNWLLNGGGNGGVDYKEVLSKVKSIVPEAITMRSHSLTDNSLIEAELRNVGIRNNLNLLFPPFDGMVSKAYKNCYNINVIPFLYEDDVYILSDKKMSIDYYLSDRFDAPRIFNMHPIHVFLNTDKMDTYVNAKPYLKEFEELKERTNNSEYGTRDFLVDLISRAKELEYDFLRIKDGNWK